jgi:hypothetical protein
MNQRTTIITMGVGCLLLAAACGGKKDDKKTEAAAPPKLEEAKKEAAPTSTFERSDTLAFCDHGTHVEDGLKIVGGNPYAMLIRGTCNVTLKHCVLQAAEDAEQPNVQVMEGATARFEDCVLVAKNPKMPAIWVSGGSKVTLVRTRLESIMKNSVDVWENSTVESYDSSWTGEPNVRETGKLTKLDAPPP